MALSLMLLDSDDAYREKLCAWTRVHPELGILLVDLPDSTDVLDAEGAPRGDGVLENAGVPRGDGVLENASVPQQVGVSASLCAAADVGVYTRRDTLPVSGDAVPPSGLIVLIGVRHAPLPPQWMHSGARIMLLEENGRVATLPDGATVDGDWPILRKYQPAGLFFQSLLQAAAARGWHRRRTPDAACCRMTVLLHPAGSTHLAPVLPVLAALCAQKAETAILSLNASMETRFWYPGAIGGGLTRMAYDAQNTAQIDAGTLRRCLVRDEGTGVHVIHSAELPEDALGLRVETVAGALAACGELGVEMLLVDVGDTLSTRNLQLARAADQVLLVLPSDIYGAHAVDRVVHLDAKLKLTGSGCWQENQPVRWLFLGAGVPPIRCSLPASHAVKALPLAYPDGLATDGWEVSDTFLRTLHALVSFCGRSAS